MKTLTQIFTEVFLFCVNLILYSHFSKQGLFLTGEPTTVIFLNQYNFQMFIFMCTDKYSSNSFSKKLLFAKDRDYKRDPHLVKMQRIGNCAQPQQIYLKCNPYT